MTYLEFKEKVRIYTEEHPVAVVGGALLLGLLVGLILG